jgi:hypothetical protein
VEPDAAIETTGGARIEITSLADVDPQKAVAVTE